MAGEIDIYRCWIYIRPEDYEAGGTDSDLLIAKISPSKRFFKNNRGIFTGDILIRCQDEDVRQKSAKKCTLFFSQP